MYKRQALDPVQFQCLYQGNPGSAEGRLYQPFKTWVEKSDYGTYIRSGAYIDVADEGDDLLFGATYDIYKSDNMVFNEKTKRMEPLLFALITDMEITDENTDVTTVTVPAMINRNGTQKVWVESNNGGEMCIRDRTWTAADERFANNTPAMFTQRCVRCKIKREDCPGIGRQCDKFHRSDRKTIYWRLLRIVGGFKGVETLEFNYNGTIAGVKVKAAPDSNNK